MARGRKSSSGLIARWVFAAVMAAALPLSSLGASKASPVAEAPVVDLERALGAFFDDLDRQTTTANVFEDEGALQAPSFPKRDELHARMAARIVQIDRLRARTMAGESTRGFLEARVALSNTDEALISEENADRLAVYEAIAAQARTKVDTVGRARGLQISVRCRRGIWVQNSSGGWGQKT